MNGALRSRSLTRRVLLAAMAALLGYAVVAWAKESLPASPGSSESPALFLASRDGDGQTVERLLQSGAEVSATAKRGFTALHAAAANGHWAIARALLNQHAEANARTEADVTPLHLAAARGEVEMLALLVSRGASLEAEASDGSTPLAWAVGEGRIEAVRWLLAHHARVDAANHEGETALHLAANSPWRDVAEALLDCGAQINARSSDGSTPLHKAANRGLRGMIHILNSIDEVVPNDNGWPATRYIAEAGHENYDRGVQGVFALLLARGADVNARDNEDWTPLHRAAERRQITETELLLEAGADPNAPITPNAHDNLSGWTPLHWAAVRGQPEITSLLLAHRADPNARGVRGETPLSLVRRLPPGAMRREKVEILLLKAGATP